jgi:formylglycine-generating enzyme required for sulfatase activity
MTKLRIPAAPPACPAWAGGFGVDKYGVFADLIWGEAVQRLRWIEPGPFNMGSPKNEMGRWEDEGPVHPVAIVRGFWIGDTPVTQAFYETVIGSNPSNFKGDGRCPVENVSWDDSRSFCDKVRAALPDSEEWLTRLPSEAEWEYGCRAGTHGPLYSEKPLTSAEGRCPNLDELAWYYANSESKTHPVKEKAVNPWGLYDMLGNVWEWCEDHWNGSYNGAPIDGSPWLDSAADKGRDRVFRGGCWGVDARWCRAALRIRYEPGYRDSYLGFRLVLSLSSTGSLEQNSR